MRDSFPPHTDPTMLSAVPASHAASNASSPPSAAVTGTSPLRPVTPVSSVAPISPVPLGAQASAPAAGHHAAPEHRLAPSSNWDHLWFALVARAGWNSLAIVPGSSGIDTLAIARVLASVGHAYLDQPVLLVDATSIEPGEVAARTRATTERASAGARVLVATGSPSERAACIAMARAADAAILVVASGETNLSQARRALHLIGTSHFVGAITLDS
jgi:hypothetical protein